LEMLYRVRNVVNAGIIVSKLIENLIGDGKCSCSK